MKAANKRQNKIKEFQLTANQFLKANPLAGGMLIDKNKIFCSNVIRGQAADEFLVNLIHHVKTGEDISTKFTLQTPGV
jgi:hypothetical protein